VENNVFSRISHEQIHFEAAFKGYSAHGHVWDGAWCAVDRAQCDGHPHRVKSMMAKDIEAAENTADTAAAELRFPDQWLSTEQAAAFLHKSAATLQNWRNLGRGPAYHRGIPVLYSVADLNAYMARQRVDPEQ
jgi:hypothetical protein